VNRQALPDTKPSSQPSSPDRSGMTPASTESIAPSSSRPAGIRLRVLVALATCAAVVIGAGTTVIWAPWRSAHPTQSVRYLGVYEPDAPHSYAGLDKFAQAIGRQPNLVIYYSHWLDPFQAAFATAAAQHGATTLVQIAPKNVSLADIAAGKFDPYLRSYATAVKGFGKQIVLSFGHEMNGDWYSWGYKHAPANVFVAAWRHIVTVFRSIGATNVSWLWTVNIIGNEGPMTSDPAAWWPGNSYVNWVGIDGYYYTGTQTFADVFGPTIVEARTLTRDPIIIAETGASIAAGQSAKVTDLFTGIQTYGLMGFVWFDADDTTQGLDWRLRSSAALDAFSQDAKAFMRPLAVHGPTQAPSSSAASS
jgi:mannan endo-1,4-beta-mannosidase